MPKSLFTSWTFICKSCLHRTWWWRKLCTATEFLEAPHWPTDWTSGDLHPLHAPPCSSGLKDSGAASRGCYCTIRLFQLNMNTNQTWFQAGLLRTADPESKHVWPRGSWGWCLRPVSCYVASDCVNINTTTAAITEGSIQADDLLEFVPVLPTFETWLFDPNNTQTLLWSIDTYYITTCT